MKDTSIFLTGGGEMGQLTRAYDWAGTPIGTPDQWPQSLLTTVSILINSRFPMFLWWGEDHIQFYNDAYRPSLGNEGKHPTALGQKGKECWPEIWPTIYPLMQQVLNGGESTWLEDALIPIFRNGRMEDVYWTFSYSPVKGDTGKVDGVLVVCTETTKSVQAFQHLKISEQRFSNLIREATMGIVVLEGEDMVVTVANQAYCNLIGRTTQEVYGKELFSIIPEAAQPFRAMLDQVRLTGQPIYLFDQPYSVFAKGKKIEGYLNVVYEPYRQIDGKVVGVMALCQDVSAQVESIQKLKLAETSATNTAKRLELALAAAKLGSFEYILELNEVRCDQQCRSHFGFPDDKLIRYEDILASIIPEDRMAKEEALQTAVEKHQTYNTEYRVRLPNGSIRWIRITGSTFYDDNGKLLKIVGVTIDITEQKLFTAELRRQVHERTIELQRSNDDLLQFAHVTSHDLKEPIRKIKIWSDRLKKDSEDRLTANSKFYLDRLQHSTDRILTMIDSILSFSKANFSHHELEKVDLNEIIYQVKTDLELLIIEKQATINHTPLPLVEGAGILIYQLFYNLIYNSLKFSRQGVAPAIQIISKQLHPDQVIIEISDNGIGFNNEYKDRIFSAFTRLNSKDHYEGAGIGLALCKKVVERHGGTITASSIENQGTIISVQLPLNQTALTSPNQLPVL